LCALDEAAILRLDTDVALSLLETRHFRFECGCTQERMLDCLTPVFLRQGEELIGGEQTTRIHCPR
jgi:molecular chaperone Hsp33